MQHQRPPTSPRQDVVVVFYPLHRQIPRGETRRLCCRLVKKKDPVSYTRSLYARGTEGCTLETHPSQKEDPIFDRSASYEIGHHPRIVGESKCEIEKSGTTSYDSTDKNCLKQFFSIAIRFHDDSRLTHASSPTSFPGSFLYFSKYRKDPGNEVDSRNRRGFE